MLIMSALPPFVQRSSGKLHRARGSGRPGIEIEVVIRPVMVVRPIAAEQIAGVEINNVVREDKGNVFFLARSRDLVLRAESEDIVANVIPAAIVLVEPGAFATVNHVVLQHDVGAAFVRVKSPAAVGMRVHLMNQVVANYSPLLNAKRIDAAHVAEHTLADVV